MGAVVFSERHFVVFLEVGLGGDLLGSDLLRLVSELREDLVIVEIEDLVRVEEVIELLLLLLGPESLVVLVVD